MARTYNFEPIAVSHEKFRFQPETKTFVAEASDFGRLRSGPVLHQIYPDAADVGFALRGQTGQIVIFHLARTDEKDGDIRAWEYEPISESVRAVPTCKGTKVVIFND